MDGEVKTDAFRFCCDLCASVPVFDLHFRKDDSFLSLLARRKGCRRAEADQALDAAAPAKH
jgi:hypothetical protein